MVSMPSLDSGLSCTCWDGSTLGSAKRKVPAQNTITRWESIWKKNSVLSEKTWPGEYWVYTNHGLVCTVLQSKHLCLGCARCHSEAQASPEVISRKQQSRKSPGEEIMCRQLSGLTMVLLIILSCRAALAIWHTSLIFLNADSELCIFEIRLSLSLVTKCIFLFRYWLVR